EPSQALKDAQAKAKKADDEAKKAEDTAAKAKLDYDKLAEKDKAAQKPAYDKVQKDAKDARTRANDAKAEADKIKEAEAKSAADGGKKTLPTWAAVASFKMKEVHQSGKMTFDLNKYTESAVTLRFDGNVGDV